MLRRGKPKEPSKPPGRPGRPRNEPATAESLRALADTLRGGADAYHKARTTVVAAEAHYIREILEAVGSPAAGLLCSLPERPVAPTGRASDTHVVLVQRLHDSIALWNDNTLALVPYEGDGGGNPVHFASAQDFVDHVGVGFAQQILVAIGRELKRANAKVPGLVQALETYAATLPGAAASEGEGEEE